MELHGVGPWVPGQQVGRGWGSCWRMGEGPEWVSHFMCHTRRCPACGNTKCTFSLMSDLSGCLGQAQAASQTIRLSLRKQQLSHGHTGTSPCPGGGYFQNATRLWSVMN